MNKSGKVIESDGRTVGKNIAFLSELYFLHCFVRADLWLYTISRSHKSQTMMVVFKIVQFLLFNKIFV